MNVLGIDTSTPAAAVCVVRRDGAIFEPEPSGGRPQAPRHSEELMPAIRHVMDASELSFRELDAIAVGTGPGGFTGLRIGIATARALGQASGVPLKPVSSLAALAAGTDAELVLALIDARRGESFAALHGRARELWAPFVVTPEELGVRLRAETPRWASTPVAVGDGSLRFRHVLESAAVEVPPDESPLHAMRALHVCRLAAGAPAVSPDAVLPTYLRAPDARPAR